MFKNSIKNARSLSYKIGRAGQTGYATIRTFERKAGEIDRGLGGVLGDIYRASPVSLFYNQTVVPAKKALQITGKVFTELGKEKSNRQKIAEGVLNTVDLVSGGTNDFLDRTVKSQPFLSLYHSPFIQNYLNQ